MKKHPEETTTVMENINFCYLNTKAVDEAPLSTLMPVLNYIAADWELNLSHANDLKTATRILRQSVRNN